VHNSLRRAGAEIALNSELLVAAVAFEVVNASAMNYVYFKPSKVSVPQKVHQCFSSLCARNSTLLHVGFCYSILADIETAAPNLLLSTQLQHSHVIVRRVFSAAWQKYTLSLTPGMVKNFS
jgi:hypothetical protein